MSVVFQDGRFSADSPKVEVFVRGTNRDRVVRAAGEEWEQTVSRS